jgi:EpsI family protein
MFNFRSSARYWITAGLLVGASLLLHSVSHGEAVVPHRALGELPQTIGGWSGTDQPLQDKIVQTLGVSDYISRAYMSPQRGTIDLYVGYYANQRTGDTIHSPKNCLPGAGWDPVRSRYIKLSVPDGGQIVVNEYVIQQGLDRQLVFYWYQGRGRVIANEYSGKFWMVADALSRNRTDGALVRLVTPMNDGEAQAQARLTEFTEVLFPLLQKLIPK